jgi:hypothetical protein
MPTVTATSAVTVVTKTRIFMKGFYKNALQGGAIRHVGLVSAVVPTAALRSAAESGTEGLGENDSENGYRHCGPTSKVIQASSQLE